MHYSVYFCKVWQAYCTHCHYWKMNMLIVFLNDHVLLFRQLWNARNSCNTQSSRINLSRNKVKDKLGLKVWKRMLVFATTYARSYEIGSWAEDCENYCNGYVCLRVRLRVQNSHLWEEHRLIRVCDGIWTSKLWFFFFFFLKGGRGEELFVTFSIIFPYLYVYPEPFQF